MSLNLADARRNFMQRPHSRAMRVLNALGVAQNLPPDIYQQLCVAARQLGAHQHREDFRQLKLLLQHSAPQSKIIEYLLAPTFPDASASSIREEIAAKFYENVEPDYEAADQTVRALSIVMASAAAAGFGLGVGVFVIGALSGDTPTATALQESGIVVIDVFKKAFLAGMAGAGGWFGGNKMVGATMSMKKARRDAMAPTGLNKIIADDNGPAALNPQYGFKDNQSSLIEQLSKIPHPERHLLKHLTPHDLRVFLLSDDSDRIKTLQIQPPPAAHQRLWRLAGRQEKDGARFFDFGAIKDELEVMLRQGLRQDTTLIKTPVSMGHAIAQMRERYSSERASDSNEITASLQHPKLR